MAAPLCARRRGNLFPPLQRGGQGGIISAQMNPPLTPPLQGGEKGYLKPLTIEHIQLLTHINSYVTMPYPNRYVTMPYPNRYVTMPYPNHRSEYSAAPSGLVVVLRYTGALPLPVFRRPFGAVQPNPCK